MKKYIGFLIAFFTVNLASCQIDTSINESNLEYRVKQLDEFFGRFNYEYDFKGNRIKNRLDTTMRIQYILSLFDINLIKKADSAKKSEIKDFVSQIVGKESKSFLITFADREWYAETLCQVKYKGKDEKMKLTLKVEQDEKKNLRWSLVSAKAKFLEDLLPKDTSKYISPIAHELKFMDLSGLTEKNKDQVASYTLKNTEPDQLTLFLYLIKTNQLQVNFTEKVTFHFLQVQGWAFQVTHFERKDGNTGWLISSLQVLNTKDLAKYKKQNLAINY